MPWARLSADLIVVVHAAFFSFVVLGLLVVLIGIPFRWGWVRNAWFRSLHLAAIGFVMFEGLVGMKCPLTMWEKQLRKLAGQATYPGDFLGYWAHRLIFYDIQKQVLTAIYFTFGLAVLAAFILAPPRWRRRPKIEVESPKLTHESS